MTDQLPLYQCHKTVRAAKITGIRYRSDGAYLEFEDKTLEELFVTSAYVGKHEPHPGGYYVYYDNHYESFSPADAFEAGYKRIDELPAGFDWAALQKLRKASA